MIAGDTLVSLFFNMRDKILSAKLESIIKTGFLIYKNMKFHIQPGFTANEYGKVEIEREFMKGYTTTGVVLCELFFHFSQLYRTERRVFHDYS